MRRRAWHSILILITPVIRRAYQNGYGDGYRDHILAIRTGAVTCENCCPDPAAHYAGM